MSGRRRGRALPVPLTSLAFALLLASTPPAAAQSRTERRPLAGAIESAAARYAANVAWLADDARQGRGIGTDGLAAAGAWLESRLAALGLDPAGDSGGYRHTFGVPAGGPHADPHSTRRLYAFNVVGRLAAGAPDPLPGVVVIGAHYDHLGFGGEGSLEPDVRAIHNGADDNASGTAALLEVARVLIERRGELKRDIVFVAFSGEERGLIGSRAFVRSPPDGIRIEDVVAMLNLDMVGALREQRLQVLGGNSGEEWKQIVEPLCSREDLECVIGGDGFGSSDQSAFYEVDIPVLHFFTGAHERYHRPSDDADAINAQGGVRVAWLAADVATVVSGWQTGITLVKSAGPPPEQRRLGGRARLGTIPDYAGASDGSPGVLLAAVRPGSPAERGGLQRGDRIVRIDDQEIQDINDFMNVLSAAEPGQEATVEVVREGKRVRLGVTYGARE